MFQPFLRAIAAMVYLTALSPAFGQTNDEAAVWKALRSGGHAIMFRHSVTDTGNGEGPNYEYGKCLTERQLNVRGHAKAKAIGARFRSQRIKIGEVLSSAWCRCRDTAQGAFGRHNVWPSLNVLNAQFNPLMDKPAQDAAVIARIASQRSMKDNLVLVTHQLNIISLTGLAPAEGDAVVVRFDPQAGSVVVVGELRFE
jgi:phosphohistidine phosphatase SixA